MTRWCRCRVPSFSFKNQRSTVVAGVSNGMRELNEESRIPVLCWWGKTWYIWTGRSLMTRQEACLVLWSKYMFLCKG